MKLLFAILVVAAVAVALFHSELLPFLSRSQVKWIIGEPAGLLKGQPFEFVITGVGEAVLEERATAIEVVVAPVVKSPVVEVLRSNGDSIIFREEHHIRIVEESENVTSTVRVRGFIPRDASSGSSTLAVLTLYRREKAIRSFPVVAELVTREEIEVKKTYLLLRVTILALIVAVLAAVLFRPRGPPPPPL